MRAGGGGALGRRRLLVGASALLAWRCARPGRPSLPSLPGVTIGRHPDPVSSTVFLDEDRAISADRGFPGTIIFWDLRARRALRAVPAPASVLYLDVVAGDPGRLVVAGDALGPDRPLVYASVLDAETGRERRRLDSTAGGLISLCGLAVLPRGRALVSYADRAAPDGAKLFSLETGERLGRSLHQPAEVVSADRRWALAMSRIWDVEAERIVADRRGRRPTWGVAVAPDGARAVSQSGSGAFLWTASRVVATLRDQRDWLWAGTFTPDGRRLLTASDARFVLRDGLTARPLADLDVRAGLVRAVAVSPSGRRALAGHSTGAVTLWTLPG